MEALRNTQASSSVLRAWKVSEIVDALSAVASRRIVIPAFQRTFVWNEEQRTALVESIRKGYPVGSILLYRAGFREGQERLQLVDGLQRTVTLKKYLDSQFESVTAQIFPPALKEAITQYYFPDGLSSDHRSLVSASLVEWFRSRVSFSPIEGYSNLMLWTFLNHKLDAGSPTLPQSNLMVTLQALLDSVKTALDIASYEIPVIEFAGAIENLPEIFDRLNTGGTKLAKYDILAASWNDKRVNIRNVQLIESIKNRYRELLKLGLELEAAEDDHFERLDSASRFLLFEFVFACGRCLKDEYPQLFGRRREASTEVDSIGFMLATLTSKLRVAELGEFAAVIQRVGDADRYFQALSDSASFVEEALGTTLAFPLGKESARKSQHTEFQIAALVASVFRLRYDDAVVENSVWKRASAGVSARIKQWYVYDIIRGYWRNSGDSKSYDFVRRDQLIEPVPADALKAALDSWYQESIAARNKDFQNTSRVIIKTLGNRLRTMPAGRAKFVFRYLVQPEALRGSGINPNNPANVLLEHPDSGRAFDPAALGAIRSGQQTQSDYENLFGARYERIRAKVVQELYPVPSEARLEEPRLGEV